MKKILLLITVILLMLSAIIGCRTVQLTVPETLPTLIPQSTQKTADEDAPEANDSEPTATATTKPTSSPASSPTASTSLAPTLLPDSPPPLPAQPAPIVAPSQEATQTPKATATPKPTQAQEQTPSSEESSSEPPDNVFNFKPIDSADEPADSNTPTKTPAPCEPDTPEPTPAQSFEPIDSPSPTASPSTSTSTSDFVSEVIRLTNVERAKAGVGALKSHSVLAQAAAVRTRELHSLFSHTRPDGTPWHTVYGEFNLNYTYAGENLAIGYTSPESVVQAWMNSPGHKENLLDGGFVYIGVSHINKAWTQLFATGI